MRRRTKHRQEQEEEYSYERRVYFSNPLNRICDVKGCWRDATDIHHMKGREGDLLLDKKYWMPVCRKHHIYIEKHPVWAKENGYSLNRLSNEQNDED